MLKFDKPLNMHIIEFQNLNDMPQKVVNICVKNNYLNLFQIINHYFLHKNFLNLDGCGKKTNDYLISFYSNYIEEHKISPEDLKQNKTEKLFDKIILYSYECFKIPSHITAAFYQDFSSKKFPFFKYLEVVFDHHLCKRDLFILHHCYRYYYDSSEVKIGKISTKFGYSKERIRQVVKDLPYDISIIIKDIINNLCFINQYVNYRVFKFKIYSIDCSFAEKINCEENTNFTPKFLAFTLNVQYKENFFLPFSLCNVHNHNVYFLIDNNLNNYFDFIGFYLHIKKLTNRKNNRNIPIKLSHLIEKFKLKNHPTFFEKDVPKMCKKILQYDFNLKTDHKGFITLEQNSFLKHSHYVKEILLAENKPLSLEEIQEKLHECKYREPKSLESLRSSILNSDEIVAIGKTSTYVLKSWKHIKTETIKQLVYNYLSESNDPVHINEIAKYINQYRETTTRNIITNLKLDKSNTFIFFKNEYVGLKEKNYQEISTLFKDLTPL